MSQSELIIIVRPSFKKIVGKDACRAALFNHVLFRLANKAKDEPESRVKAGEVYWFASAEDICKDIDEAWCVNKVRKEMQALADAGIIGRRHNQTKKWDRKYQYYLTEVEGGKLLERCEAEGVCLMHIGLNAEVLHLLHMVNAFNKNGGCNCQIKEMETPNTVNAFNKNGGAIPETSSEGTNKGEESESNRANAEHPFPTCEPTQDARASATQTPFDISYSQNHEDEKEPLSSVGQSPVATGKTNQQDTQPILPVIPGKGGDGKQSEAGLQGEKSKRTRSRKSKQMEPKYDEVTRKRLDTMYDALDAFKRTVLDDANAIYPRNATNDAELLALLSCTPSPSARRLTRVCYDMWNECDKNGKYFWRRHMTPKNIRSEYETRIMALEGKNAKMPADPDEQAEQLTPRTLGNYAYFSFDDTPTATPPAAPKVARRN